jgi:hypothetical protein
LKDHQKELWLHGNFVGFESFIESQPVNIGKFVFVIFGQGMGKKSSKFSLRYAPQLLALVLRYLHAFMAILNMVWMIIMNLGFEI